MQKKFLVDVNLPKYFSFFNDESFIFVQDINLKIKDSEIWEYVLINELIILKKDTDFLDKFFISESSPKIIMFNVGNLSLKNLYLYFEKNWTEIALNINTFKLIIAKNNTIECVK